jgi:hypothetical protein
MSKESMMATADGIRTFAKTHYVDLARRAGASEVAIRAGDVHSEMRLKSRLPLACTALGSKKFEELCGVRQTKRTGPHQGSNTTFHYELSPSSSARLPEDVKVAVKHSASALGGNDEKQPRIVSIDDLARVRRSIVDLMNDIEGRPPSLETTGQRLGRLKRERKIPRTVAQFMFAIIEARNEGEWQRTQLTDVQSAAVLAAWAAVQEWKSTR